ncbi:ssrA-binding protein [Orientia chuto str. Dubai]|uniref:SsrA-binding protein n=1 Tax=Orientia chuto str. Dubai TaxID=1359168 RepID=A0A0F3MPB6_9RICK|nr:SsrA-binding protein SmpB [Candidatus Orientia mediorientalis]KJV57516.1 ssrA-binding protein [Orientia chuto str. Dubai]
MESYHKIIAQNRKAKFNYSIQDKIEAGIVLQGSELKSIRSGKVSIEDSYAADNSNEIFLYNAYIAEYKQANRFNHIPRRVRKLLLHRKEIRKIIGKLSVQGYTLVPLSIYFNSKNILKVELGLAKGKKHYDKRYALKEQEWKKQQARIMRNKF